MPGQMVQATMTMATLMTTATAAVSRMPPPRQSTLSPPRIAAVAPPQLRQPARLVGTSAGGLPSRLKAAVRMLRAAERRPRHPSRPARHRRRRRRVRAREKPSARARARARGNTADSNSAVTAGNDNTIAAFCPMRHTGNSMHAIHPAYRTQPRTHWTTPQHKRPTTLGAPRWGHTSLTLLHASVTASRGGCGRGHGRIRVVHHRQQRVVNHLAR